MEIISNLLIFGGCVVLFMSSVGGGARDGRFKTGRRDNVLPTKISLKIRMLVALTFWVCAAALKFPRETAYFAAVLVLAPITWVLFPYFTSRWTRYINSPAQMLASRTIACILFAVLIPFSLLKPFDSDATAIGSKKTTKSQDTKYSRLTTSNSTLATSLPTALTASGPTTSTLGTSSLNLSSASTVSSVSDHAEKPPTEDSQVKTAPSFNCNQARLNVERIICNSAELSALDLQMSNRYATALEESLDSKKLRIEQRQWINTTRNACDSSECIEAAYSARIDSLALDERK